MPTHLCTMLPRDGKDLTFRPDRFKATILSRSFKEGGRLRQNVDDKHAIRMTSEGCRTFLIACVTKAAYGAN